MVADKVDVEARVEHRVETGNQEHTSHDHRAGVQQRRHRGGAGHGVGQPRVQWELTALADTGDEQGNRREGEQRMVPVELGGLGVDLADVEVAEQGQQHTGADEQSHVADTHGPERLERGLAVGSLFPPMTDEHERAEAHDLPAEDQLHHVRCEHHGEHSGGEQREAGEEVRVATIATHVLGGVDLHERGDERHEEQQHHRQAIDT